MKKVAALAASLAIAGLGSSPAFAATQTGAVKFTWTIPVSFTAHIASDYKTGQASFATGTGTVQTSTSAGSGTCTTGATDAFNSYTLTFGTVTPGTGATGCNYQNALGISVNTNDANGYTIGEAIDLAAAPTNWGVCVFSDGASATATTPASTQGSAPAAGTFTAGALTGCAAGGTLLPPALGAISNAGVGGDVGGAGATSATVPTTPIWTVAAGAPASGTNFYGEDVQLNVTSTIASGITTRAVIVYLVPG